MSLKRVILFGATGHLGSQAALELKRQGYYLACVVRNEQKALQLANIADQCIMADVTRPAMLKGICNGFDIIFSALGKSVSINDHSRPGFEDIDLDANTVILEEAKKSGIKKFVYISALHAESFIHLNYFRVHHVFSERVKNSGIDYSIIKPPALFSAFLDLVPLAKKGWLVNMGKGDKRTNPISEKDLAAICVDSISRSNIIIEAGGQEILTRKQINEAIQRVVAPGKKIYKVPLLLVKAMLPLLKLFNHNTYDKMSFYVAVMQQDVVAPRLGETRLEDYLREYLNKQ